MDAEAKRTGMYSQRLLKAALNSLHDNSGQADIPLKRRRKYIHVASTAASLLQTLLKGKFGPPPVK
jgi:hypothetical protein